ncbi:hypothetical protein K461DRAFT_110139 [Myriangium duriaei CBS 260.36]|uniref:Uncharacterized protein n=1 Tax=Myriangium duriaei CBS 260.36 TaxID=1168546 RepID=A0A9P4J6Y9_9PEZI|nr:hypothetical protein K461DRAFT_110139 [Myriangium duriaei CBS 260.36]
MVKASDGNIPQPTIISREVDDDDSWESEYRLQIGDKVKYLVIAPGTFTREALSLPLYSIPNLPYAQDWNVALIA